MEAVAEVGAGVVRVAMALEPADGRLRRERPERVQRVAELAGQDHVLVADERRPGLTETKYWVGPGSDWSRFMW